MKFLELKLNNKNYRFHYFWLRDNCPDSISANGQKLHESNSLDLSIEPQDVDFDGKQLKITWPDGHQSQYSTEFLRQNIYDREHQDIAPYQLWDQDIQQKIKRHDYQEICVDVAAKIAWLQDIEDSGLTILKNVPTKEKAVFDVIEQFGYLRKTNYGDLFEVRAEEKPSNLAFSPLPLSVHTDNPYRDPCPSLQLLHCLVQSSEGGISAFTDGFSAAEKLKNIDPKAFKLLSEHEVEFRYKSDDALLEYRGAIIRQDSNGHIVKIRINNRSMCSLNLPFDIVPDFYRALFKFRGLLEDPSSWVKIRLEPGDLALMNNERILHGRVGHSVGYRHLQGCYADIDTLLSTLKILKKESLR